MTIDSMLRKLVDSPLRRWAVIMLTLGISLALILPAADEYSDLRERREKLCAEVARSRHEVASLETARKTAADRRLSLAKWEARTVPADQVHEFRQEIVELARSSNCQVRRISVGDRRSREWKEGDDALEANSAGRQKDLAADYVLHTQSFSLSLVGTLADIKTLLSRLRATNRLIHSRSLSLTPVRDNPTQVVLELSLMFFDLTPAAVTRG